MTDLLSPAHIAALGLPPLYTPAKARKAALKGRVWAVGLLSVTGLVLAVSAVVFVAL